MASRAAKRVNRVALAGNQTLQTIAAGRVKIMRALDRHAEIEIDCSTTSEADVSLVQLLLAARLSAARAGKSVAVTGSVSDPVRKAFNRSGVADVLPPEADHVPHLNAGDAS